MNILVLGVNMTERDVLGGVVDYNKLTDSEDDVKLKKAIDTALAEAAGNDTIIAGSAFIEYGFGNTTNFAPMPFTGTIDHEVCIYTE